LVTVTRAAGMTAPLGSVTVPTMLPKVDWAGDRETAVAIRIRDLRTDLIVLLSGTGAQSGLVH
jgi:hypothetical protein